MKDLEIDLENRPGALAAAGEALGRAGVSIEGGGAFVVSGNAVGHFLFEDATAARRALEAAGVRVLAEREVLVQRLNQEEPGQLGKFLRSMAEAAVNIVVLYSDHDHQLVLVVDEVAKGRQVSEAWMRERGSTISRATASLALLEKSSEERGAEEMKEHTYNVQVKWTGNDGSGTKSYKEYRRDHVIMSPGKPPISGSSDPDFRGDPTRYNPEELLVASLSACHMLWYLHLCSVNGLNVVEYSDLAWGVMEEQANGSGAFVRVQLRPAVTIADGDDRDQALALHHEAHRYCYIANSVRFPVDIKPEIVRGMDWS